jgi:hypothetical protein
VSGCADLTEVRWTIRAAQVTYQTRCERPFPICCIPSGAPFPRTWTRTVSEGNGASPRPDHPSSLPVGIPGSHTTPLAVRLTIVATLHGSHLLPSIRGLPPPYSQTPNSSDVASTCGMRILPRIGDGGSVSVLCDNSSRCRNTGHGTRPGHREQFLLLAIPTPGAGPHARLHTASLGKFRHQRWFSRCRRSAIHRRALHLLRLDRPSMIVRPSRYPLSGGAGHVGA